MVCDVGNSFPDTWLWRHGVWWFKVQAGHVIVMIWYVMVETVTKNVTVMAWYEMAQAVIRTSDFYELVGDGSNCYLDTWLWWDGRRCFKLLPGHMTVMIQIVSRNATVMIWCVMVQTVSRTRDCDDTRINSKSDLRTGDWCLKRAWLTYRRRNFLLNFSTPCI
jgi:hypothetical protein